MSCKQEEKRPDLIEPTHLSSRNQTNNIINMDSKEQKAEVVFNTTIESEQPAKNNGDNKEKEPKSQSIISYNTPFNQSDSLFPNKSLTITQSSTDKPIEIEPFVQSKLYHTISRLFYSNKMIRFYYIDIVLSLILLCGSVTSFFLHSLMIVIEIVSLVVFTINLLEILGRMYVYGIWGYLRKYIFLFDLFIIIPSLIGCCFILIDSLPYGSVIQSLILIISIASTGKAALGLYFQSISIRNESVVSKNVEEIIQFDLDTIEKSFRKTKKPYSSPRKE